MAFKDSSIFLKIAPVILSVAALFIVIGLSTNSWVRLSATVEGVTVNQVYGPWKTCVYAQEESGCSSYPQIPDFVKAVRGLTIVGFLVIVAGIVLNALCLLVFDTSMKSMHIATTLLAFVAGVLEIIGAAIAAAKYKKYVEPSPSAGVSTELYWSFALVVTGACLALMGGGILVVNILHSRQR